MVQEPLALSCKTKRQHGRPRPKPNGRSTTIPPSHSRAILSLGAKVKVKHGLWWNVCWCKRRSNGFMWWLQRDGFTIYNIYIYIYVYSIFRIAKPSHVAVQNSHDPWPPSAPRSFAPEGADPAFAEQPTTLPAAVANSQHPSSA